MLLPEGSCLSLKKKKTLSRIFSYRRYIPNFNFLFLLYKTMHYPALLDFKRRHKKPLDVTIIQSLGLVSSCFSTAIHLDIYWWILMLLLPTLIDCISEKSYFNLQQIQHISLIKRVAAFSATVIYAVKIPSSI